MTANSQLTNGFYVPPTVKTVFNGTALSTGQVKLFRDPLWSSRSLTLDTNSAMYPEGAHFSWRGTDMENAATWIAFNLPAGVVFTLYDKGFDDNLSNPYDFAGLGGCVDLIGNGLTQTVDLAAYGLNDCLSGGIWRTVNTAEGWFQMFRDPDCNGLFTTFFMDEWPTRTTNSLVGWYLQDTVSSINFPCITRPSG